MTLQEEIECQAKLIYVFIWFGGRAKERAKQCKYHFPQYLPTSDAGKQYTQLCYITRRALEPRLRSWYANNVTTRKKSRAAKKEAKELRTEVFFEAFWQDSGVVGIRKVLTKVVNKGLGFVKQQIQNKAIFSMNKKNQDYIFGFIRYLR